MKSQYDFLIDNFHDYTFENCWKTFYKPLVNKLLILPEENCYDYFWFRNPHYLARIQRSKYKYEVVRFRLTRRSK